MDKKNIDSIKEFLRVNLPSLFAFLKLINTFLANLRRNLTIFAWIKFLPKKNLLIYVGVNRGESLSKIFYRYNRVIAIEANPDLANFLTIRFNKFKHVEIYNFAASNVDGLAMLKIPNNGNYSASATIDQFADHRPIKEESKVEVSTRNLEIFLKELNISEIDSYISDCEGMDFLILNSLKSYIDEGKIKEIQCEVQRDETPEAYKSISNKEYLFDSLLQENYFKVAKGWTELRDGVFSEIPNDWVFFDIKWRRKQIKAK